MLHAKRAKRTRNSWLLSVVAILCHVCGIHRGVGRLDKRTPFRTLGVAQSEQEVHHAFDQGNGSAREALPFAR